MASFHKIVKFILGISCKIVKFILAFYHKIVKFIFRISCKIVKF